MRRSRNLHAAGASACTAVLLALAVGAVPFVHAHGRQPVPSCLGVPALEALGFWTGSWDVFVGDQRIGTNRISPILGGCALVEEWVDARGSEGRSLFYPDPASRRVRQVWVTGAPLTPGGVKEKVQVDGAPPGAVRFQGMVHDTLGREWLDRTTLTEQADGSVRQLIEISTDNGATWRATFDAQYRRPGPRLTPEVLIEGRFTGAEGLAFSNEGRLFMAANRAVWEVRPDWSVRSLGEFASNLGLAASGPRDLFFADFGPLVFPQAGPNDDGIVWRLTPEGTRTRVATGIGDPNAIVVLPNGELLVSDDFTNHIYRVSPAGVVTVFSDAIPFPNGMALAPDGSALYVARIFARAPDGPPPARFEEFSDQVWRLPLRNLAPAGPPELLFRTGGATGPDGLALGPDGRLYLSAAREGQLWRIDPATGQGTLLAEGLPGLASLAFGRGAFGTDYLYATQIRGGRLLRFRVGTTGGD